jgi:large subunit ribosomal protein L21
MHALIEYAGKQFKIEEGSSIKVPHVQGKVGSKVNIDKILYFDDGKNKIVGTPLVNDAKIDGEITSHGQGRKVVVFKFKRRKGYQNKNTHRQDFTILKVGKLSVIKKQGAAKMPSANASKKTDDKKGPIKKVAPKKTPENPVAKKSSPTKKNKQ